MSKTILFEVIQFRSSTQFCSIWTMDRAQSVSTTPASVYLGEMAMKRYSASPKAPGLLEPLHEIV